MSYILDALKRSASDSQVGKAPGLHTQSASVVAVTSANYAWPVLAIVLCVLTLVIAFIFKPWQQQAIQPEVVIETAPEPELLVRGEVNYERYPVREKVELAAVRQPQPQAHSLPLPQQPISAGKAQEQVREASSQNKTEALEPAQPEQLSGEHLQALFAQAVADTQQAQPTTPLAKEALPLTQLPSAFQDQVPSMDFNAHSYSSVATKRMVKVNGATLHEGDWIGSEVQLKTILPSKVVLEMQGQQFTLPALGEW